MFNYIQIRLAVWAWKQTNTRTNFRIYNIILVWQVYMNVVHEIQGFMIELMT